MLVAFEWKELRSLQEVAAAQAAGEEIEYCQVAGSWTPWVGSYWDCGWKFRSRPAMRTKKIVLREALFFSDTTNLPFTLWCSDEFIPKNFGHFSRWLDTPAREIEVVE